MKQKRSKRYAPAVGVYYRIPLAREGKEGEHREVHLDDGTIRLYIKMKGKWTYTEYTS